MSTAVRVAGGAHSWHVSEMPRAGIVAATRWFVEVPAVAGRCWLAADGMPLAELRSSWTFQQVELPACQRVGAEVLADPDDPFGGFLPWIRHAPRGLWQGLRLRGTGPAAFLLPPWVRWRGGFLEVDAPWDGPASSEVRVAGGGMLWQGPAEDGGRRGIPWPEPRPWSPGHAERMSRLEVALVMDGRVSDRAEATLAVRRLQARGTQLLLNGEPVQVRGLLHWGFYPDLPGPDPDPEDLRRELRGMKERGFNLLKCCLFVPPERFLDVCDEEGMLVWMEYPLWARPLRDPRMLRRYEEFLRHDAGHPSVVLRTFTCENDAIEPALSRAVAERVRAADPGALLADNSGWVGTAHVADFYDEHAYLNCAQWPFYLERMERVFPRLPEKPFFLGEAMVADASADPLSRAASMAVRRFQAERLLAAFPGAGYVICGARDTPDAPCGVQYRDGRWKDRADAWAWQRTLAERARGGALRDLAVREPPDATPLDEVLPAAGTPEGVLVARSLMEETPGGGTVLDALRAGARVLHLAGLRAGSWRVSESTFWSPVPLLDSSPDNGWRQVGAERLCFDLCSGRVLAPAPPGAARVLVGIRDLHGRAEAPLDLPLVLAARVGRGRLLVSALDSGSEAGRRVHAALCREILESDGPLPELALKPPPRSYFLNGPWELRGEHVAGGRATVVTGTPAENAGRNVFLGWAEFAAPVTVPADWEGPLLLRAESIGDGWELFVDGRRLVAHGNLSGTWDSGRDVPLAVELREGVVPGQAQGWRLRVRDHRGGGGLVGPLFLTPRDPDRRFLF